VSAACALKKIAAPIANMNLVLLMMALYGAAAVYIYHLIVKINSAQ
jgi:hypothetical protein